MLLYIITNAVMFSFLITAPILSRVAMKLDRVASPLFFALASSQQASVPPPREERVRLI
jgi:hypothetical protein